MGKEEWEGRRRWRCWSRVGQIDVFFFFFFLNSCYRGYVLSADCGGQGPAWRVSKEEGDEDDGSRGRFLAPLALPPSKHPPLWMRECCWIAKTDLASSVEKNFAIHLCLALQRFPSFLLNKRPSFVITLPSCGRNFIRARDDVIKWKGMKLIFWKIEIDLKKKENRDFKWCNDIDNLFVHALKGLIDFTWKWEFSLKKKISFSLFVPVVINILHKRKENLKFVRF